LTESCAEWLAGLCAAEFWSMEEDRECISRIARELDWLIRSIIIGFFADSRDATLEREDSWISPRVDLGLKGVSAPPSNPPTLSVLGSPGSPCSTGVRSDLPKLSRLFLAKMLTSGDPSAGLLMLRRPVEWLLFSSTLFVTPRVLSRSLKALTVTGAIEGEAAVDIAGLAILGMIGGAAVVDFGAVIVVVEDGLDDGKPGDRGSAGMAPDDVFPGICSSDEILELSPLPAGGPDDLGPVLVVFQLLLDAASWLSSSTSWEVLDLPATPTASLNLL
jgi:hypothetical protein